MKFTQLQFVISLLSVAFAVLVTSCAAQFVNVLPFQRDPRSTLENASISDRVTEIGAYTG
jgi:hypothetical protein